MEIRLEGDGDWRLVPAATREAAAKRSGAERGGGGVLAQDVVPPEFLREDTSVALVTAVAPRPRRGALRGTEISPIDASVDVDRGESAVMVARHPSGALTFHPPIEPPSQTTPAAGRRGAEAAAAAGPRRLHFRVEMAEGAPARRGMIAQAIKLAVVKVAKAAVDKVVAKGVQAAGRAAEAQWWTSDLGFRFHRCDFHRSRSGATGCGSSCRGSDIRSAATRCARSRRCSRPTTPDRASPRGGSGRRGGRDSGRGW